MTDEPGTPSTTNATAVVAVIIASVALVVAAVALGYALRTPRSPAPAPAAASGSASTAPTGTAVAVAESEYTITAVPATVPAGAAELHVTNNGNAAHELIVLKTDAAPAALPLSADGRVDLTSSSLTVVGQAQNIVAGGSANVSATLPAGHYVLICNITGHYAAGMHTGLDVT